MLDEAIKEAEKFTQNATKVDEMLQADGLSMGFLQSFHIRHLEYLNASASKFEALYKTLGKRIFNLKVQESLRAWFVGGAKHISFSSSSNYFDRNPLLFLARRPIKSSD